MTGPLLEITDLSIRYGGGRRKPVVDAVRGVSLDVRVGETVGLVGESGSGKSSIGNAVLGLVRAASGSIRFDDEELTTMRSAERRAMATKLQAIFQDPYSSLNRFRTVGQSVVETLPISQQRKRWAKLRAEEMLERVGLERSAVHRYPSQFSGGQRQRIAIARSLMPEPKLIVCDEPVSALDLSVQAQVLNLLMDLRDELGLSYLLITHDVSVVEHAANRVAVLQNGELLEFGSTAEVLNAPEAIYTAELIAAVPVADPVLQAARRLGRRACDELVRDDGGLKNDEHVGELRRAVERMGAAEGAHARNRDLVGAIEGTVACSDSDARGALVELHSLLFHAGARGRVSIDAEAMQLPIPDAPELHIKALADAVRQGAVSRALAEVDALWIRCGEQVATNGQVVDLVGKETQDDTRD